LAEPLNAREETVLYGLLTRFMETREPVGSRFLAERDPEGLSPATLRSILARLEDMGYLRQPHASAGRVPTDLAYRHFARGIMRNTEEREPDWREVERLASDGSLNALAREVSGALARSVHMLGFAVTPPLEDVRLRSCDLVRLGENRVLCVVVSQAGQVHEKVLRAPEPYSADQLRWFGNFLNETFAGCTFPEIRRRLQSQVEWERARCDGIVLKALQLVSPCFLDRDSPRELFWDGAEWLFYDMELRRNLGSLGSLLESLEKKTRLIELLDALARDGEPLRVVLGEDWPDPAAQDLAMVAAPFGGEETGRGVLGIIGFKALRYDTAIPSVRQAAILATLATARL
jgi:heat-inducible transcriptional repressor